MTPIHGPTRFPTGWLVALAAALLAGQPIPQEAAALMAKPIIPGWLYRAMGVYGWHAQAKHFGAEKIMKRQPYSSVPSRD